MKDDSQRPSEARDVGGRDSNPDNMLQSFCQTMDSSRLVQIPDTVCERVLAVWAGLTEKFVHDSHKDLAQFWSAPRKPTRPCER